LCAGVNSINSIQALYNIRNRFNYLYRWIRPRLLTFLVENCDLVTRKAESQKIFREFSLFLEGTPEVVQRITVQRIATETAAIILLSYGAAYIIAKMKFNGKGSGSWLGAFAHQTTRRCASAPHGLLTH
jgi:hypothetical protein